MSEPASYTAVLMVAVETVLFRVAAACRRPLERGDSGSAAGAGLLPANSAGARWLIDGTPLAQLAKDNAIGRSTAYRYLHEGIDALVLHFSMGG